ncbi:MAG: HIT domain-containing protein [Candidatus Nanopelagicales bacterium]|nr:HIT domain-containing protein [Candidatus Nanopelagicales bacterium]
MTQSWDRIYTPHRLEYLRGAVTSGGCPFCAAPELNGSDALDLVAHRGQLAYVVLNLYPYNAGHLLICPYRHVADYTELTDAERDEISQLTQESMRTLRAISGAQGFNLGMNQGSISGAGIAAHLHQHVVPRWGGDANFMPVIGETKILPQLLTQTRDQLQEGWISSH